MRRRPPRPTSSSTSATTTIARGRAPPATPVAQAVPGATATTPGAPTSSSRRAACSRPRRGSSCAAITRSCNRAGQGWWRFLDPRPLAARQDCNDPADDDLGNYSEPYAVPLGRGADTQLLVFDSSLVGVVAARAGRAHVSQLPGELAAVFAPARARPTASFWRIIPCWASRRTRPIRSRRIRAMPGCSRCWPRCTAACSFPTMSTRSSRVTITSWKSWTSRRRIRRNSSSATAAIGWTSRSRCRFRASGEPAPGARRRRDPVGGAASATRPWSARGGGWRLQAFDVDGALVTTCTLARAQDRVHAARGPRAQALTAGGKPTTIARVRRPSRP